MATLTNAPVPELPYADYQQRQLREITTEQLTYRAAQLREAEHFRYENDAWQRLPYPGYAVLSMVDTNPVKAELSNQLQMMQNQLLACFDGPAGCFPLPADSFHQTVANTFSASRFQENIVDAGLKNRYPSLIEQAFSAIDAAIEPEPIPMRLIGLSLFSSAIGILGTFDFATDYARILAFREPFYANESLANLDVRRTRPFIGHITLAYLGCNLSDPEKQNLVTTCTGINRALADSPLYFHVSKTELRRYDNLAQFDTRPGFPAYSFVKP